MSSISPTATTTTTKEEAWAVRLKSYVILKSLSNTKDRSISNNDGVITIDRDCKKNTWKYDYVIEEDYNDNTDKNLCELIQEPVVSLLNLGFNSTILVNDNVTCSLKDKERESNNTIIATLKPILTDLYANDINDNIDVENDNIQILKRTVSVSCYELYNDTAYDLLASDLGQGSLKLRTRQLKDTYETHVDGLQKVECSTISDINRTIEKCVEQRLHFVATTSENVVTYISPISHFFITISIDQTTYTNIDNIVRRRCATLSVLSLAPSDGLSYRGSNKETMNLTRFIDILNGNYNTLSILLSSVKKDETVIDKHTRIIQGLQNGLQSLSTLQRVVKLLNENITQDYNSNSNDNQVLQNIKSNTNKHIPYRDSILTRILQSSLQGNCVLYLLTIVNRSSTSTSINALRFAYHMGRLYTRVRANDHLLGLIQQKKGPSGVIDNDVNVNSNNNDENQITDVKEEGKFRVTLEEFSMELLLLSRELDRLEKEREESLKRMGMSLAVRREIAVVTKLTSVLDNTTFDDNSVDEGEMVLLSSSDNSYSLSNANDIVNANSNVTKVRKSAGRASISSSDDSTLTPSLIRAAISKKASPASTMTSLLSSTKGGMSKSSSSLASPRTLGSPISSPSSVVSLSQTLSPIKKVGSMSSPLSIPKNIASLPAVISRKAIASSEKTAGSSINKQKEKKADISNSPLKKMVSLPVSSRITTSIAASSNSAGFKSIATSTSATSSSEAITDKVIDIDGNTLEDNYAVDDSNTNTESSNTTSRERILSISNDYGTKIKNSVTKNTRLFPDCSNDNALDVSGSYDSIPSINSTTTNYTIDENDLNNSNGSGRNSTSTIPMSSVQKKKKEIYYISNRRNLVEDDDDGDDLTKDEKAFLRYVSSNQVFSAEKMLIAGINVHVRNNFERDAIQIASRNGCNEMIKMLLRFNANISSRGAKGDTNFHLAAANGFVETMKLLHSCGILPEAVDSNGQTVAHIAARRGEINVLQYLYDFLGFTYHDFLNENFDGQNCYDVIPRRGYNQEDLDLCREFLSLMFQKDPRYKQTAGNSLKLPSINKVDVSTCTLKDLEKMYINH